MQNISILFTLIRIFLLRIEISFSEKEILFETVEDSTIQILEFEFIGIFGS